MQDQRKLRRLSRAGRALNYYDLILFKYFKDPGLLAIDRKILMIYNSSCIPSIIFLAIVPCPGIDGKFPG